MGMNGIFVRFRSQQLALKLQTQQDNKETVEEKKNEEADNNPENMNTPALNENSSENLPLQEYFKNYDINSLQNCVAKPVVPKEPVTVTNEANEISEEDSEETIPPAFTAELANAINSQDMEVITYTLDKLGISYTKDKDASKNYQNAFIVKFIYEGQEFDIPCEDKSISYNMQMIDNSIEAQLNHIKSALKSGHTEYLEDLKKLGIEYDFQESGNGGYIVTFSYEGKDYVAAQDFVSEGLTFAINSQDIEAITHTLDKLGISYTQDKDTSKNYQNAYVIKFIYENQEFNIPCEYKSISYDTQMIDNSIDAQLNHIESALKNGHTEYLEDLKKLGIEYDFQESGNGGYIVTFSYEGKDYVAAQDFVSEGLTFAINSQDIEAITHTLDKLGISYTQDKDTSKNYQNAYVIKFIYENQEFNIPCEYKSISYDTQMIDNSIDAQLNHIESALKNGHTEYLEDLKKVGIEYDFHEFGNGGYMVTFSYEGKDYVAAYIQETENSPTGKLSQAEMDELNENINQSFNFFSKT